MFASFKAEYIAKGRSICYQAYKWMWDTGIDLKDYEEHSLADLFKFELKQVKHHLNKHHGLVKVNWLPNDDFSILKLILYGDSFFWLLNCFLSNNGEYKFTACSTRTFHADVPSDITNWKINALPKPKDGLQAAINIAPIGPKDRDTLELYKDTHTFPIHTAAYLGTWVFPTSKLVLSSHFD